MDRVFQVEMVHQGGAVGRVSVHVVAEIGLGRPAMATTVMRDHAVSVQPEEQHLAVPIVRAKRPAMVEHDRLTCSPILVVDLCTVLHCDAAHESFSCWVVCSCWLGSRIHDSLPSLWRTPGE